MNIRTKDIIYESDFLDNKKFTNNKFLLNIYSILEKKILYSKNHNNSNSKVYKSIDKKKQLHNHKTLSYNAWFDYEKLKPNKKDRYNYITFKRIVRVLLCEVVLQIIIHKRSWYITNMGYHNVQTSLYKRVVIKDKIYPNVIKVLSYFTNNATCSKYVKRFSLKLNAELKEHVRAEHFLQKKQFISFTPLVINSKP